jgi:GNAT superfamily N-acetyltransferase
MIREAVPADVLTIRSLIEELAVYEREPDAVEMTEDRLRDVLFSEHPAVHALVAETDSGQVVGTAVWFLTFSTWTGTAILYLEDLFVRPEHRREGHARALLGELARRAMDLGCRQMAWAVLDWNEPAKQFYRSIGAHRDPQWEPWIVTSEALAALAGNSSPG